MAYGKVEKAIWNDAKFAELSNTGKLIFICLLTHPAMTQLGAMRATPEGLRMELGLSASDFETALRQLRALGMVRDDAAAAYIEVVNFLKYNQPANPNQVKSWVHVVQLLPECELKTARLRAAITLAQHRGWLIPPELTDAAGLQVQTDTGHSAPGNASPGPASTATGALASHAEIEAAAPPIGVAASSARPRNHPHAGGSHGA